MFCAIGYKYEDYVLRRVGVLFVVRMPMVYMFPWLRATACFNLMVKCTGHYR